MDTDRIEKTAILKAPVSRVWNAISDSSLFGEWMGASFEGPFVAGERLSGKVTEPEEYAGMAMTIVVDRIEPEALFSYRWHPGAADESVDYSREPMTLVEFRLEAVPGGTRLTITESGFDQLPPLRRDVARTDNTRGWEIQIEHITRYVGR